MEFIVRRAKFSDAEALACLHFQFWVPHESVDPLIELKHEMTMENEIKFAQKDIKKKETHILVADLDGEVIGFIEFFIKKNDDCFKIEHYGYIDAVTTDERHRGKGVARALTDAAMDLLRDRGIRYVKTNVYNANQTALEIWQRMGFQSISTMLLKEVP